MVDPHAAGKRAAARSAVDLLPSPVKLGLGTGSTVAHALDRIAERIRDDGLEAIGVPTSEATAERARELDIALTTLSEIDTLDVTIDGADEVDPHHDLIKGGGGALTREKIVAAASERLWIIVSENKLVPHLGATFDLPIEILPFGCNQTERRIAGCGLGPALRTDPSGQPITTDNGNFVLDCKIATPISDLAALATELARIPGVVENGLFLGMTDRVFVGREDGSSYEAE